MSASGPPDISQDECRQCRICWGEEGDVAAGLAFVSPCRCRGSLSYMHVRCLQEWQRILRDQGQIRKAKQCEICKQPYKLQSARSCGGGSTSGGPWIHVSELISRTSQQVLDLLHCHSYLALAYRCWKVYILCNSVVGAARVGAEGLRAGFGMGKTLVEEQTNILINLLGALGELLGTPYAELLWCQAVACVAFALASELVYTSLLGLLAGGVIGFFRGYLTAVQASLNVATMGLAKAFTAGRTLTKAARFAFRLPLGALRVLTAAAVRKLPVRIIL